MGKFMNYLNSIVDSSLDFVQGYQNLHYEIYRDAIVISDKYFRTLNQPTVKRFVPELRNLKDYILNTIEKTSKKINNLIHIFGTKSKIVSQNINYENFRGKISNVYSTSTSTTSELTDSISGKNRWKWKDREQEAKTYLDAKKFTKDDYLSLLKIRDALKSNKYLTKKYKETYESIDEKIDEALEDIQKCEAQ